MADSEQITQTRIAKVRHDWYQTETHTIINILYKNIKETDLKVDFKSDYLNVSFPLETGEDYNLQLKLCNEVIPSECSFKALSSKIEIKLKKKEGFRWDKLERDESSKQTLRHVQCDEAKEVQSSGRKPKNWDKVVNDITNSDEFKPEGEEALNALFEKIYAEGSDEVKKAMRKSFIESDGTVLSTNWAEVKQDKVDVKPPDGVEWKKWES